MAIHGRQPQPVLVLHLKPSWMIMATGTADPLEDDFRLKTLGTRIYKIVLVLSWLVQQKHGSEF